MKWVYLLLSIAWGFCAITWLHQYVTVSQSIWDLTWGVCTLTTSHINLMLINRDRIQEVKDAQQKVS